MQEDVVPKITADNPKVFVKNEPEVAATPATNNQSEKDYDSMFKDAQKDYDSENFQSAYDNFSTIGASSSDPKLIVNSKFMMGESLFNQREYDKAILAYQRVISEYSKSPIAPKALLRQAQAFEKLSDPDTAKILYKKLVTRYRTSQEADVAKSRLIVL